LKEPAVAVEALVEVYALLAVEVVVKLLPAPVV
jgi:hypothetical protein